jgi:chromosome segregation ATPase
MPLEEVVIPLEEANEARLLEGQVRLELKKLELGKLDAKLNTLRNDWFARVEELRAEMQQVLSEKDALEECLANKLHEEQQNAEQALTQEKLSFDAEISTLSDERNELHQECLEQRQKNEEKESSLRDISLRLSIEIDKSCSDHNLSLQSHVSKIEALKATLEQQSKRRVELEEHFARVDRNNAAIKLEEERLRNVLAKEEAATKLLHKGACGLQKLWRGVVAREQFAKLKKKKKGKGKKGKGKGKKGKSKK